MLIVALIPAILLTGPLADRLISDELGISIDLPPRSTIVQRPGDAGAHFMIRDGAKNPTWSLKIDSPEIPGSDPKLCLQALLDSRKSTYPVDPETFTLLESSEGRAMASVWTTATAQNGQPVSLGWLVAPQSLNRCLVLSVVMNAKADDRDRFEQIYRSLKLTDRAADAANLMTQFKAGDDVLKSLTESHLRDFVGSSMVLRVYDPTVEPPREIAYGTLEATINPRSAIRSRSGRINEGDDESGLLVTSHLRFAENAAEDVYLDRVQRCWVSWDLEREAWTDSVTRRAGDDRTGQLEVVIKTPPTLGVPRGQLLVIREDETHGTRDTWTMVPEQPWLPRALRWLVWERSPETRPERVAWHVWDETTTTPRLTIRRDAWDPELGKRQCWSWSGVNGLPTALSFDAAGRWSRATQPGGTVIEVSDSDRVTSLWKAAGLKMR
jgi:hypothetical protein